MKIWHHIIFVLLSLFVILGIPSLFHADWSRAYFLNDEVDAISGATLDVPDQPSGVYYVFVNKNYHSKTLEEWQNFFEEKPVDVIMEDISCQVLNSDSSGFELAQRYQARLAENQMKLKTEDAALVASKIENAFFDVAIISKDFSDIFALENVFTDPNVRTITIEGEVKPDETI
ncbi:MAG: hypothetical protein IJI57_17305 [Flexilinea sp.]|nr:hypothetical protein [Flexilinea sp.]